MVGARGKRKPYKRGQDYVSKAQMAKVLRELEWSAELEVQQAGEDALLVPACPLCFQAQVAGHEEKCELGRVIRGVVHL